MHVDADEWLSGPREGQTLLDSIEAADAAGYNCVHFNEFVFVPRPGEDFAGTDYRRRLTRYYFYRPRYPCLLRAWMHRAGLDNCEKAGQLLSAGARWCPQDFPLRHYMFLSEAHAQSKYLTREFYEGEIARGWHLDRLRATKQSLRFPDDHHMATLPAWGSKEFDTSKPLTKHYWEWVSHASSEAESSLAAGKP